MSDIPPRQPSAARRAIPSGTVLVAALAFVFIVVTIVVFTLSMNTDSNSMPGMDMSGSSGTQSSGSADQTGEPTPSATDDMSSMPGMDTGGDSDDMSEMGGMDMRPVDVTDAPRMPASARGNQPLEPTTSADDDTKEFSLTASVIRWSILPDVEVGAFAYNEQVPGPELRVTEGDAVRVRFRNDLPESTTIHWHGLIPDNGMDGAGDVTQAPVEPGGEFVYEFVAERSGTYFYHTHTRADRQQTLGLYGALIIEPRAWVTDKPFDLEYSILLGEWKIDDQGQTLPAMNQAEVLPNFFTINGKSYPATETVNAKVGDRIRFRFIGSGQFIHPMHIHGGPFEIVETDGNPVPEGARLMKDTVLVGPGERYDVEWTALKPGKWLLHCHINDHLTNNGAEEAGGGGLTMIISVAP